MYTLTYATAAQAYAIVMALPAMPYEDNIGNVVPRYSVTGADYINNRFSNIFGHRYGDGTDPVLDRIVVDYIATHKRIPSLVRVQQFVLDYGDSVATQNQINQIQDTYNAASAGIESQFNALEGSKKNLLIISAVITVAAVVIYYAWKKL